MKEADVKNLLRPTTNYFPHQIETLKRLAYKPKYSKLVILPAGAGKTLVALTFANTINQVIDCKTIIITENNLIDQIKEDYDKFYLDTTNIISTKKDVKQKRINVYKELIDPYKDILVLNYHSLANDIKEFMLVIIRLKLRGYKIALILDEAENISGETSNIRIAVEELMKRVNFAFGMTASPLKNYLDKTHNILKTLKVPKLPDQKEFYEKYCDIELQSILTVNYGGRRCGYPVRATSNISDEETKITFSLWAFIKPILQKVKTIEVYNTDNEVIEAEMIDPYKKTLAVYTPVGYEGSLKIGFKTVDHKGNKGSVLISGYVSVRKNVKGFRDVDKYYKRMSDYFISYAKKDIGAIPPFKLIVRELETGVLEKKALKEVYVEYKDAVPYASETIATVCPELELWERELITKMSKSPQTIILQSIFKDIRMILKRKEKVILFTKYTTVAEYVGWLISKVFNKPYGYVHGGLTGKDSITKIKNAFNSKELDILILTESGLRGLNLQVANNTICIDLPVSSGDLLQLAGRTSRLGSKHKLLKMYMYKMKDTVTEDLYNLVFGQMKLIELFNPDLLEQGLFDDSVAEVALDVDTNTYTRVGLKRRKDLYN